MKNTTNIHAVLLRVGLATGLALTTSIYAQSKAPNETNPVQTATGTDPVDTFIDAYINKSNQPGVHQNAAAKTEFYKSQLREALSVATAYPQSKNLDDVLGIAATLAYSLKDFEQAESLALQASDATSSWVMKVFWLKAAGEYAQATKNEAATVRAADVYSRAVELALLPAHRQELLTSEMGAMNLSTVAIKLAQLETARGNHATSLNLLTRVRTVIQDVTKPLHTTLAASHHGVEGLAGMEVDAAAAAREIQRGIDALLVIERLDTRRLPTSTHADRFARIAANVGYVYTDAARKALASIKPDRWTPAFELRIALDLHSRGYHDQALAEAEKLLNQSLTSLEAIDAEVIAQGAMPEGSGGHISALYALIGSTSLSLGDVHRANSMLTLITERFPSDPQRKALADQITINQLHRSRSQNAPASR